MFNFANFIPFLTGFATVMTAFSAIQMGRAAKAAGKFNAEVARQNAQLSKERTELLVRQADRERYLRLGTIRAAQGKAGGKLEGSVLDILADTAAQSEIERQDIILQGQVAERNFMNTALLEEAGGRTAGRQGYLEAGSALLGGGAMALDQYTRLRRT